MEEAIYALVDPRDNLEFYVGRTQDIYQRFIQHLRCQDKNDAKNARIRELQPLHLLPIMRTLEIVQDAALSAQREAYWIRHFRYLGIALSNDIVYIGTFNEVDEIEDIKPKKKRLGRVLTVAQAAEELQCTQRHVRNLRKEGTLAANESGLIIGSSLKSYIGKRKVRAN